MDMFDGAQPAIVEPAFITDTLITDIGEFEDCGDFYRLACYQRSHAFPGGPETLVVVVRVVVPASKIEGMLRALGGFVERTRRDMLKSAH